ncbi:RNA polymerase sigma factor [Flectobacillus major]|uniref:RNA polymerase sigma factor n=1 Tax=Flectobacillus major TaxID=103 RepID=UPI00040C5BF8|nr:sigma-70 family RNA polymerase sigma factor [Flectobacillus major]
MNLTFTPQQIVTIIRSGNPNSVEYVITFLYKKFKPIVNTYVFKHGGSKDDASDLFQEVILTFIDLVLVLKFEAQSMTELQSYFLSITKNKWMNYRKAAIRRSYHESNSLTTKDLQVNLMALLEQRDFAEHFRHLLTQLGYPCNSILEGYYSEQLSLKELSEKLKIASPETLKVRKLRCLEKLKELVLKYRL